MEKLKEMFPYMLANAATFYLMPLLINDTGGGMLVLLIAMPIICLIASVFYGIKHSFCWLYGLVTILLFLPTIFIFYNESAAVYIAIYGGIAFLGNCLGAGFHR